MTPNSRERADRMMTDKYHRCSLEWHNNRLDTLEEEIINVMKIKGWQSWELLHYLIGERENTKCKLKDIHKMLYG
jgi:hypothetical protein